MVKIYPSVRWRIFGYIVQLICHNLENTKFLTEFRIICSEVPITPSSPQLMFRMAIVLFSVNLRNIGATLQKNDTIWKTRNVPCFPDWFGSAHHWPHNYKLRLYGNNKAVNSYRLSSNTCIYILFSIWEFLVAFLTYALSGIYEQIACLHGLHI